MLRIEIFPPLRPLLSLKYRTTLNVCYLCLGVLWVAWCLYWPFLVRNRDIRQATAEAEQSYRVCLEQPGLTRADCHNDREAYEQLLRATLAPPEENAYQLFAGEKASDAIAFMSALCLLPPLIVFAFARFVLEVCLFFARA